MSETSNTTLKNPISEEEAVEEEVKRVQIPSGQLAVITKVINKIKYFISDELLTKINHNETIQKELVNLENKVEVLKAKCIEEDNEQADLLSWFEAKIEPYKKFKIEIGNYLKDKENKFVVIESDEPEISYLDSISQIGSNSQVSRASKMSLFSLDNHKGLVNTSKTENLQMIESGHHLTGNISSYSHKGLGLSMSKINLQRDPENLNDKLSIVNTISHYKSIENDSVIGNLRKFHKNDVELEKSIIIAKQRELIDFYEKRKQEEISFLNDFDKSIKDAGFGNSGNKSQSVVKSNIESKVIKSDIASEVSVNTNDSFTKKALKVDVNELNQNVNNIERLLQEQMIFNKYQLQANQINKLEKCTPDIFTGDDITLYKDFLLSFKINIERYCQNSQEKLFQLLKFTSGKAKNLIRGLIHLDHDFAYNKAISLLNDEYANPYSIAEAYLHKIASFKEIKYNDRLAFKEFSQFLVNCNNVKSESYALDQLDNIVEINKISLKLPYKIREMWTRKASKMLKVKQMPKFKDFVDFVEEEADIMNVPLLNLGIAQKKVTNERQTGAIPKNKSFYTETSKNETPNGNKNNKEKNSKKPFCIYCKKGGHLMNVCKVFIKLLYDKKIEFIKENKLCFGCLSNKHFFPQCTNIESCTKCKKHSLTILHREIKKQSSEDKSSVKPKQTNSEQAEGEVVEKEVSTDAENNNDETKNFHTNVKGKKLFFPAVPVKIKLKGSKEYIETYVALDTYSSATFMDLKLAEKLGLKCNKTQIDITTLNGKNKILTYIVNGLEIRDMNFTKMDVLNNVYCKEIWPFKREEAPSPKDIENLCYLKDINFNHINAGIGILIGMNESQLLKPLEIIQSKAENEPFAVRYKYGWVLQGDSSDLTPSFMNLRCLRTQVHEQDCKDIMEKYCKREFTEQDSEEIGNSQEDLKWKEKIEKNVTRTNNGKFEVCLPFKNDNIQFPDNKAQALSRIFALKNKFLKNEDYFQKYKEFIVEMLQKDYIEKIPKEELYKTNKFYLTHHSVEHPQKKKLRVVFNASMMYNGISLNNNLLKGPDLIANLQGILLRFRTEKYAFIADIKQMFYQIQVSKEHRDYLRFFWFSNNELQDNIEEYRLKVHLFGSISSPTIANYILKKTTEIKEVENYSEDSKATIKQDFYVDDLLKSVSTEEKAIHLYNEIKDILNKSGFHLHGVMSNSKKFNESVDQPELLKEHNEINLSTDKSIDQKVLGLKWNIENDFIQPRVEIKETEILNKRNILSHLYSIYDPHGWLSPVVLTGKRIFQLVCNEKINWDTKVDISLKETYEKWSKEMQDIKDFNVPRHYNFQNMEYNSVELHIFADASQIAFAAVAYIRYVNENNNQAQSSLIMSKTRLIPMNKSILLTVPRVELCSAKLAVQIYQIIKREMNMNFNKEIFWTDSTIVLQYIKNETKRFKRFVTNRVSYIRAHTQVDQWKHVQSKDNIADIATKGISVKKFLKCEQWLKGPKFLNEIQNLPDVNVIEEISPEDEEIITPKPIIMVNIQEDNPTEKLLTFSSNWYKTKRNVACFLRLKKILLKKSYEKEAISLTEIKEAEIVIYKYLQEMNFKEIMNKVKNKENIPKKHTLAKLNPFFNQKELLRVGGRIKNWNIEFDVKYPIILPNKHHIIDVMIRYYHKLNGHLGKQTIITALRQKFHIIGVNNIVKKMINNCLICKKLHGRASEQIMGDLPKDRLESNIPPFTNIGIDVFGPFLVIRGRVTEKRYGLLFSCLNSRAIHIEMLYSLNTDAFINGLRRFISRRGEVKIIRSDNGTNFVSANKELKEHIRKWNNTQVNTWFKQKEIDWKFQPPAASHQGGHFERHIRTIRNVLQASLAEQVIRLNDDNLNTLFCEIEFIINNRPLTEISNDINDLEAITPNHLLTLKGNITYPPGLFQEKDCYLYKRWKQVQYLADLFWKRWITEYLPILQARSKWIATKESHKEGDLILLIDDLKPRNSWCIGRIIKVYEDDKGRVRVADVKVNKDRNSLNTTVLRRPITKLILLRKNTEM